MRVGISACSNGHLKEWEYQIDELTAVLKGFEIEPVFAPHILVTTDEFSGTDEERAADLMRFYEDDSIEAIYDISGGDLANGVLKYIDFDVIANSRKRFWGYSDLTTVINAIYAMTGKSSVLYQVKNMVYSEADLQKKRFADYLSGNKASLFDFKYEPDYRVSLTDEKCFGYVGYNEEQLIFSFGLEVYDNENDQRYYRYT